MAQTVIGMTIGAALGASFAAVTQHVTNSLDGIGGKIAKLDERRIHGEALLKLQEKIVGTTAKMERQKKALRDQAMAKLDKITQAITDHYRDLERRLRATERELKKQTTAFARNKDAAARAGVDVDDLANANRRLRQSLARLNQVQAAQNANCSAAAPYRAKCSAWPPSSPPVSRRQSARPFGFGDGGRLRFAANPKTAKLHAVLIRRRGMLRFAANSKTAKLLRVDANRKSSLRLVAN